MKLMIVDGHSILHRAFHGVKPLSNHKGVFTNAIYGFFNILLKAIDDTGAENVVIAFDCKEKTFRHNAVDSYKANRKAMPEELAMQFPLTKQILEAMGYPVVTCAGWEADDILGTLSAALSAAGEDCILLTGDRDNLQLINQHVSVRLATNKEPILYDTERFQADYGFAPKSLIDLKALMGDSSDNIKGVAGIGEKTASALIQKHGTIEALYEALPDDPDIKPAAKQKLTNGLEDAKQSKWLATIVTDAPIPTALSAYERKPQDTATLSELLTELELYKLMERLHIQPAASTAQPSDDDQIKSVPAEKIIITAETLDMLCARTEPVDFIYRDSVLYLAWEQFVTCVTDPKQVFRFLTSETPKRTFDAKPVYRMLMQQNETLHHLVLDDIICAYLLDPSTTSYAIERLCHDAKLPYQTELGNFADAAALPALSVYLENQIIEQGMETLLRDIEMPLIEVLADMEHIGVRVDAEGVQRFGEALDAEIKELSQLVYQAAGKEFNILSPKQLGVVLFEDLALKSGKKTKTGWSTNAEVLEGLRGYHPIVDHVLRYRQLTKLKSTYVEGLLNAITADGRIHTNYRQTETRTGRISSTEPNLQNIPVRTELGREMRKFFIASEDCTLLDADYSQIELRLVAHLCGDENMRRTFEENLDIHLTTAAQVFHMPEDMITKEMRSAAKAVNFGILYGIGAFSLSKDIGVSVAEADRYIKDYLDSFPRVQKFMNDTVEQAKESGFVTTLFGRKRYVPELRGSNKMVQAAGKRIAMNTPIQGTAADIIKSAMVRLWQRLKTEIPEAKLILQIHDELIVEAPLHLAKQAAEILHTEMEQACTLSVPLTADVQEGQSWYDAKG